MQLRHLSVDAVETPIDAIGVVLLDTKSKSKSKAKSKAKRKSAAQTTVRPPRLALRVGHCICTPITQFSRDA